LDKKRILIIDDEEEFTNLVKMNLEKTDRYEVKIENRGAHGLASAREYKPDLILLDILMPDLGGSEVAYQLRHDQDVNNIPVVFLTAVARKEEVASSKGVIGGHPFLAKPVTIEELIDCIERNT